MDKLTGVDDPQEKRILIGHTFIDCFKVEAAKIEDAEFLAQGTLYPDVIESGAAKDGPAATIKLHHNVGGLPEELGFELIEPLRDLFKDEVRRLGIELFGMRGTTRPEFLTPAMALDRAATAAQDPVVIADVWDNPGGGVPGDATIILRQMLERRVKNAALATIWDPIAVRTCFSAGEGARR